MVYAVLGLTSVRFSVAPAVEWWLGPLIGVLTGLATAATGVFAIPAVPYLGALGFGQGGHDPGAWPFLHSLDHRACRLRSWVPTLLISETLALPPPR